VPDAEYGVLFDVDGTLIDTTYLHAVCWAEALLAKDHVVPMSDIHHAIGMGSDELLDHLLGEDRDTDEDDELIAGHLAIYHQYWGNLSRLPGARELMAACAERGLRVVLASSASQSELEALQSALDAGDTVFTATSSSDAESGKPSPDILQAALEQSGLDASRVVFVGDAVWDGAAASRAGVEFIGLTCGGTAEAELREAGAKEIWRNPADLLEHLDDSALGALAVKARA
jgi:HAD superfamily hydrolase (TIGR01549 family)